MALTNQQVLDQLLDTRDTYLKSGHLIIKNSTDSKGNTVFYRSIDEVLSYISYYQSLVDKDNGLGSGRVYFYA